MKAEGVGGSVVHARDVCGIVEEWLRRMGYDGLYHPSVECGCLVGDLMPGDGDCDGCMPGVKREIEDGECGVVIVGR